MAERQIENQGPSELYQLESQVKDIKIEFDNILMAPRSEKEIKHESTTTDEEFIQDELAEIANVANNLDSLNTVLDTIEERADQIRSQLLELLTSNREIRQSLREEYGQNDGQCQKLIEQLHDSSDKHNIDAEPSPPSSSSPPSSDE